MDIVSSDITSIYVLCFDVIVFSLNMQWTLSKDETGCRICFLWFEPLLMNGHIQTCNIHFTFYCFDVIMFLVQYAMDNHVRDRCPIYFLLV
jgi:hypothetical protein